MNLTRRAFLKIAPLPLVLPTLAQTEDTVMTVTGPVPARSLGVTLPHEHLFSTFGLEAMQDPEYDASDVLTSVLPHLQAAQELGVQTIIEATAVYFGRDPGLLRTLSERSGLHLVTNTGYYGAAEDRYVPAHAYTETADQLAGRWIREARDGIGDTGIRPGFIKIGIDAGPLSQIDRKLVEAAALTHLETGLTIAVHTGDNPEAVTEQLALLEAVGVSPSAWVWVHAHNVPDAAPLLEAAERGAWISLDGYRTDRHDRFVAHVEALRRSGGLDHILLSHDGNSYPRKGAGEARPFVDVMRRLMPALREAGLTEAEVEQLTTLNPQQAFSVKVRKTQ